MDKQTSAFPDNKWDTLKVEEPKFEFQPSWRAAVKCELHIVKFFGLHWSFLDLTRDHQANCGVKGLKIWVMPSAIRLSLNFEIFKAGVRLWLVTDY